MRINSCGKRNGRYIHGQKNTKEYKIWKGINSRCYCKGASGYYRYGARGIRVCREWRNSFIAFKADMGACPPGFVIDRTNNDGNYEPSNCKWVSKKVSARNTCRNVFITHRGRTKTLAEWSELTGLYAKTISYRLKQGWRTEDVFGLPPYSRPSL